jgi:hypothetical protein
MTRHTITGLAGFIFREPPELDEDVPVEIRGEESEDETSEGRAGLWENIDNAGTHGDVFLRDIAVDAMIAGHAAILVEYPRTDGKQTLKDEKSGNIRPYWVPIRKDNILSWRTDLVAGRLTLTQLVVKECVVVQKGMFGEATEDRYRTFYNNGGTVGWELYRITDNKELVREDAGTYPTQDEIPVAEITTSGKQGLFESEPPFLDLAYLNLAHYRQWSDYDTSIYKTCVPIFFTAGVLTTDEAGNPLVIGPNMAISSSDPAAKAEYVSHGGEALAPTTAATTVRPGADGDAVVTDGPFAETKEALGGWLLTYAQHSTIAQARAWTISVAIGPGTRACASSRAHRPSNRQQRG